MRIFVILVIAYLCAGVGTYAKVYEDTQGPGVDIEQARKVGIDAGLKWPLYWMSRLPSDPN